MAILTTKFSRESNTNQKDMNSSLIVKFTDSTPSFTNGVEFGRILARMESGDQHVDNFGFPIHLSNKDVIARLCSTYGYTPVFGSEYFDTWIEFFAIKNCTN
jgi:hypothetical protein